SREAQRYPNRSPKYDEVPVDSPVSEGTAGRHLRDPRSSELAASADPLPPPPLPLQPPFGTVYQSENDEPAISEEPKPVRRFIPDSWKNFFKGKDEPAWPRVGSEINYVSEPVECSPPASPTPSIVLQVERESARNPSTVASTYKDPYGGSGGSYNSRKMTEPMLTHDSVSLDRDTRTVMTYSEKVELYNMKYSFMKSWSGLLRILGVVQLLFGAAVFACVCAYIHKDNEWYNMFGNSRPYGYGASSTYGGYYYDGPKTPFVIVVAGLAWIITIILLVLGMSMYYRTILLDSNWWPLTEFGINVLLFILYLTAAIVYINDIHRGGLCYYQYFNTPLNSTFCRVEGGQTAGIIFLFATMFLYLCSAAVALKLWRHESARKRKEFLEKEKAGLPPLPKKTKKKKIVVEGDRKPRETPVDHRVYKPVEKKPEVLNGYIPAGHIPKPVVMPDYISKYPTIQTDEQRERYKAVFNDQFAEYKELHAEVQTVLKKFDELDSMLSRLPHYPGNQEEHDRISKVLQEYRKKKNDPAFLEKKERCEYLKNKLSHIKQKIQEYDKIMGWDDGYR
uniref:MARVEL domain containing 2 n=1 Tax=Latimeria chalumnae TaxID=7897 RepID=H3AS45_LATCH